MFWDPYSPISTKYIDTKQYRMQTYYINNVVIALYSKCIFNSSVK